MLDKQTLVIHKFQQLFDILNEVDTFLNFKLENINSDNIDEINNNKNYLIISTEKKLNFQNQIFIKEYPIDIYKLIEIININFLKNKFNQQNKIKIGVFAISSWVHAMVTYIN